MKSIETEGMNRHARAVVRAALTALLGDQEAMRRLYGAAKTYVRDAAIVHELVWDVVGDVQLGELTCDLARDLASQLAREVRRRAKRAQRDAARMVFVPLDKAPTDALIFDADPEGTGADTCKAPDVIELVARIRELAREDEAVLQLLGHYEHGSFARRKVLAAGMTQWVYRAARERLVVYANKAASAARTVESTSPVADGQARLPLVTGSGSGLNTGHVQLSAASSGHTCVANRQHIPIQHIIAITSIRKHGEP